MTGCDIAPADAAAGRQRPTRGTPSAGSGSSPAGGRCRSRRRSLDAVVAASVLEYVQDPAAVLGRVRPGAAAGRGPGCAPCPTWPIRVRWLEWPLGLAARAPLAADPRSPRRAGHPAPGRAVPRLPAGLPPAAAVRWWYAAARQAGLEPAAVPAAALRGGGARGGASRCACSFSPGPAAPPAAGSTPRGDNSDHCGNHRPGGRPAWRGGQVPDRTQGIPGAPRARRHQGDRRRAGGLSPAWLAAREASAVRRSRRVALNNVGFLTPGGERWTLLANALHFLTAPEAAALDPRAARGRVAADGDRAPGGPPVRRAGRALHGDGGAHHRRAPRMSRIAWSCACTRCRSPR